jgi:hypothetical protein
VNDICECLSLVRQCGTRFTSSVHTRLVWEVLDIFGNTNPVDNAWSSDELLVPPSIQQEIDELHDSEKELCESGIMEGALYAKIPSANCFNCIAAIPSVHGASLITETTVILAKLVPCVACSYVNGNENEDYNFQSRCGLSATTESPERGPLALNDEKVLHEAELRGIHSDSEFASSLRSKIYKEYRNGHQRPMGAGASQTEMELSSSCTTFTTDNVLFLKPSEGPATIEIMVYGIPVVAARYQIRAPTRVFQSHLPKTSS